MAQHAIINKLKRWLKSEDCLQNNAPLTMDELKDIQGYLRLMRD